EPVVGLEKACESLRPGGRFAVFWNLGVHEPATLKALLEVYDRLGVELSQSVALGTYKRDGGAGTVADLEETGTFEHPEVRRYFWEQRYSRDQWLDQLPTHSDHWMLPSDTLQAVLGG